MRDGAIPPAGIGVLAGLLTTAAVVALSVTGILPQWPGAPLLYFAGGLAAGLAAPVRPTTGALLGAVTGVFAAILLTIAASVYWTSAPNMYYPPFPLALIAVLYVIAYAPVYAVAGAVGAAVRPRLAGLRSAPAERAPVRTSGWTPERRQWTGIAAGAVLVVLAFWASVLLGSELVSPLLLVSAFGAGVVAALFSRGGARAGAESGFLSGVFGSGVLPLYVLVQSSQAATGGSRFVAGLGLIALTVTGAQVLPAAVLGGPLGGSFRRPSPASPGPDRDGDGRHDTDL
ncbi:MAG: hypothetical protein ABFC38_04205 [Methanospirillum sp.]